VQDLLQGPVTLLEKDDRLVVDGHLLKNKVVELALAMDVSLIRSLLADDAIRSHFFTDVEVLSSALNGPHLQC
jgi:adenine-specific DNA-methyltransferase